MRISRLAAQFFQPGCARQNHIGKTTRGIVHKEIVADDEIRAVESFSHLLGISKRGHCICTKQEQHLYPLFTQGCGDVGHLTGNVIARWAAIFGKDVSESLTMTRTGVSGAEASAWDTKVPR